MIMLKMSYHYQSGYGTDSLVVDATQPEDDPTGRPRGYIHFPDPDSRDRYRFRSYSDGGLFLYPDCLSPDWHSRYSNSNAHDHAHLHRHRYDHPFPGDDLYGQSN
jgi:hypothetical protein